MVSNSPPSRSGVSSRSRGNWPNSKEKRWSITDHRWRERMGVVWSKKFATGVSILVTLLFSLMLGSIAQAQVTGATLSGTITDPSGGVLVGARISARDAATGVTKEATTDSAGLYTIPNLAPSVYEVRVTAAGFSTAIQSNLTLSVGQQQQLNFSLKVGAATTMVQVTEEAPQI